MLSHIRFIIFAIISDAEWTAINSPALPRADCYMAVGYLNDTIFILGGRQYKYQLTEYNTTSISFRDIGTNILPVSIEASASFYVQTRSILYMIETSGQKLVTFNMVTKQFSNNWPNITTEAINSCLASNGEYLFVVGGYNNYLDTHMKSLQILELQTKTWLNDGPSMTVARRALSCIVDGASTLLFAIGGASPTYLSSIEALNVTNIETQSWQIIGSLTGHALSTRVVTVNNQVWVIGGYAFESVVMHLDTVHVIDPITLSVSLAAERLVYGMYGAAVLIVDDTIYCFGGYNDSWIGKFMTYQVPTASPTDNPSIIPTLTPITMEPTTYSPSQNPTTTVPTTLSPTTLSPATLNPTTTVPTTSNPTPIPTPIPTSDTRATNGPTTHLPTSSPSTTKHEAGIGESTSASITTTSLISMAAAVSDEFELLHVFIIIASICVVGVIILTLLCYVRRKKKMKQTCTNDEKQIVELTMGKKVNSVSSEQKSPSMVSSDIGISPCMISTNDKTEKNDVLEDNNDDDEGNELYVKYDNERIQQHMETLEGPTANGNENVSYIDKEDSSSDTDGIFDTNTETKTSQHQGKNTKGTEHQQKMTETANV